MCGGFIMARPNSGGILTLVDLESHEKVQLYKELLDKDERDYVETNDIPYWGDFLKFTGQKGNRLYFRNNSQLNGEDTRSYIYEMKK